MTSEIAKTIATCTIWICTAIILTFGLFRMNGETFFFIIATAIVMGGATGATGMIWRQPGELKSPRGFDVVVPVQPVEK